MSIAGTTRQGAARSAFTLFELLIVIGIVALLMAMLFPTVARVQQMARYTRCASNIRQIAQSCNSYAIQNGGRFPTLDMPSTGGNLWDVPTTFYDQLRKQGLPHEAFFCSANDDPDAQQASFNTYTHFRIISYNVWIPRKNGSDIIPPAPGANPGRFGYPSPMSPTVFAGPDSMADQKRLQNPIITDHVATGGTPPADADLSVENDYGLSIVSAHRYNGRRLYNINAGWADGHVEVIPGSEVRPRFKGNWWNWR